MVSARTRREQVDYIVSRGRSVRRACALMEVSRSALRYVCTMPAWDAELANELAQISAKRAAYGYRFAWALLDRRGWKINRKQVRSDNGPEFIARALRIRALMNHSETATIEPGKPWQNGSVESFHATFRRECLDAEEFAHLREAKIVIERWRWEYNTQRRHDSLGYRTPAEVGAEARAAMTQESSKIEIVDPGATGEADLERTAVQVHPIRPENLS